MTQEGNEHRQEEIVRKIFNEMADEYDHLQDLWYRYTFDSIDNVLSKEFLITEKSDQKLIALDIGCGTGIQSFRLALMGYKVVGVDIADELLRIAQNKLFGAGYRDAEFFLGDAQALQFEGKFADCINCCGPTLSFVPDWRKALSEMARCLKPGGKLLLEVEGKWNFDLFWEIISAIGFDFLSYEESLGEAFGHLLPPWQIGHTIDYSFKLESGESTSMPLKLFTASELERELENVGIIRDKRWGLHALTNLVPSTVLHKAGPGFLLRHTFGVLSSLEKRVNDRWPLNAFGCSLLVLAHKK